MIYLPAAAGRTTTRLRWAGKAAAACSAGFIVAVIVAEVYGAVHDGPGAHTSLYAGAILSAVVAASCLSFAYARTMIGYSATASAADHDAQTSAMRRQAEGFNELAAETADVVTTNEQVVAELARVRMAVRDSDADRKTDMERLITTVAAYAEETSRLRAAVERADAERKIRARDQIAAMASLRGQVWRLAAALERRAKDAGERVEYWRVYGDVMKDLGGLGGDSGSVEPE